MTREESLKLASYEETPYYYQRLINKIYDEFEELENRSCDSCICWDSVENSKLKTISYCRFLNTGTKNSFYCNEWENKHKITNI